MSELQQELFLVAAVGYVPDAARNMMPISSCHAPLITRAWKFSGKKDYNPDFAPQNRPIGGF